jgi:hypothetical protein
MKILLLLVAAQVVIYFIVQYEPEKPEAELASSKMVPEDVAEGLDTFIISERVDGIVTELIFVRQGEGWRVSNHNDIPGFDSKIDNILKRLSNMTRGWPVSKTEEAVKRLETTEDNYLFKLRFLKEGNELHKIYVGTSRGFKRHHFRVQDEQNVYQNDFHSRLYTVKLDTWIDKRMFIQPRETLARISINDATLVRNAEGELVLEDLAKGEFMRNARAKRLESFFAEITLDTVLDQSAADEFLKTEPVVVSVVTEDGDELTYKVFKKEDDTYALKVSSRDEYFSVQKLLVKRVFGNDRASLVKGSESEADDSTTENAGQEVP